MGIGSLFIVNNKTSALCACKHWGPAVAFGACDKVLERHRLSAKSNVVGDVCVVDGSQYLFHVARGEITYVATTERETEPLMVIEFLTQLHVVLKSYFGDVTEAVLQARRAIVRIDHLAPSARIERIDRPSTIRRRFDSTPTRLDSFASRPNPP